MIPRDPDFWAPIDLRHGMSDARLPFEAFSFNDELHLKWQPAHKLAIYNRNLDQYVRWDRLDLTVSSV